MAVETRTTERPWKELSPDEKLDRRLKAWVASADGINFASPQAEQNYKAIIKRHIDAMMLRKPDRVPVVPGVGGGFAAHYCGYTEYDMMYDVDKANEVSLKCTLDFDIDQKVTVGGTPGKSWEILDFKLYAWPGHGVPEDAMQQFNEGDYMKEDEYDIFLEDPTDYYWRVYLPRILGALKPLSTLPYYNYAGHTSSIPSALSAFGRPEIHEALEKLSAAGREIISWQQKTGPTNRKLSELGYPTIGGGSSKAPFDLFGDAIRGTRGIVSDMFKQPDKLLAALDRLVPIMIKLGVETARMGGCPVAGFALHKGADGFMSDEQFKTFYWPSLKKVCLGLIKEGLIVRMGAQGGYMSRLDIIREDGLPKGKAIWTMHDRTDMTRAKEVLGDVACLSGNVPAALLHSGTEAEVVAYVRKLIDTAGKGGGYILSTSAVDRNANVENIRAMIKTGKEYGVYS